MGVACLRCSLGDAVSRYAGKAALVFMIASVTMQQSALAADDSISYEVVLPHGYLEGSDDGRTAYMGKDRGVFDKERMNEVIYQDNPSDLPPPTVVAYSPLSKVQMIWVEKVSAKPELKGEDAIYQRISDDQGKEKCLWEPDSCDSEISSRQRRNIITSD
ncbi:hypothetical protein [Neptunomonas antarctica]|nr:hypothetical protein [Neptunomonas antarctica]